MSTPSQSSNEYHSRECIPGSNVNEQATTTLDSQSGNWSIRSGQDEDDISKARTAYDVVAEFADGQTITRVITSRLNGSILIFGSLCPTARTNLADSLMQSEESRRSLKEYTDWNSVVPVWDEVRKLIYVVYAFRNQNGVNVQQVQALDKMYQSVIVWNGLARRIEILIKDLLGVGELPSQFGVFDVGDGGMLVERMVAHDAIFGLEPAR